jgi:hypothetical protein
MIGPPWRRLALFGVVTLALVETAAALRLPSRVASDADWAAAASELRADFRDGDLIVFAPAWVDPIGRSHLGDLMPVDMVARADDSRYARVWELSIRGATDPAAEGRLERESRHGQVRLRLFSRPGAPAELTYDFTAHAEDARVTQCRGSCGGEAESPCFREGGAGFRCASTHPERRTLEIDYHPRRGLLVPVDGRRTTAFAFDATLGGTLVIYGGISDYYARKSASGPVRLRVLVDGTERLASEVRNEDGWRRAELTTEPGPHQVRFEISAPDPAWRSFGFHAEARR